MNNKGPKVTIVTVVFNAQDTIEETLLSVVNQTYRNLEYIVIDGGSKDGTIDVIKKYEDRITKWISEPDKGLYDAMNKGLKLATGEWISFKNSGDPFAEKDSLEKLFVEPIDAEVIFLHAECYRTTPWGWYVEKPVNLNLYSKQMPVVHPATFVRTNYHREHPFDIRLKVSADYHLVYNALRNGIKFEYRPIVVSVFPVGGYSTTHPDEEYYGTCVVQGRTRSTIGRIKVDINIKIIKFLDKVKRIMLKSSVIRNYRTRRNSKRMKPYPLPISKFY